MLSEEKFYADEYELMMRFGVFRSNKHKIEAHNKKNSDFTMALNKFADLTVGEFKSMYLTNLPKADRKEPVVLDTTAVPDSKDWTTEGRVTPVKD